MNRQAIFLLFIFFLLLSLASPGLAQSECDFSISNYARAVQLHDMGDYGRALAHYDCALLEDPDDPVIPMLIDNVYEDIHNASRAWERPQQPTCDPTRDNGMLGAAAFARGDLDRARTHSHCALLLDAADVAALELMGRIHANMGDAHSARHYLDRADAARREAAEQPARFKMPDWLTPYETAPRYSGGKSRAVSLGSESAPVPGSGRVFFVVIAARIAEQSADESPGARELARQASERGDIKAAIHWMLKVTNAPGATADDYVFLASLHEMNNDLDAATLALTAAVELAPARLDIRCRLGRTYKALGDYARATAQFFKVISHEIGNICGESHRPTLSRESGPAKEKYSAESAPPAQATFERGLEFLSRAQALRRGEYLSGSAGNRPRPPRGALPIGRGPD